MITIAICNKKGGSGKTTAVASLGAAWAKAGSRVLVIDLDPQADLTTLLLPGGDPEELPIEATTAAIFGSRYVPADALLVPTAFENLTLLPCSELLRPQSRWMPPGESRRALRTFVKSLEADFDWCLLDNPPDLGFCAYASLTAANYVLTPVQPDAKGLKALGAVNSFIAQVADMENRPLRQLGYVRTVHQARTAAHISGSAEIETQFPGMLLEGSFPHAQQFREADMACMPISYYKPKCAAAKAVEAIRLEVEGIIHRLRTSAALNREVA
jgi:chromosome partitioning protein